MARAAARNVRNAVYAGQPRYSLRVRNNEFSKENVLAQGIEEAHALGKQFFLASNVAPHNNKVRTYLADLEPIIDMGPDALIMADPGLIYMVREEWPDQTVHLSVQANTMNYASVRFWESVGVKRIILSRELSLDDVEEIRQQVPEMELEVFVHGALCIAYSGRCLLSGYFNHRDANQGTCTNACRWQYQAHEAQETLAGDVIPSQAVQQVEPVLGQVKGLLADTGYDLEEARRRGADEGSEAVTGRRLSARRASPPARPARGSSSWPPPPRPLGWCGGHRPRWCAARRWRCRRGR